MTCYFEVRQGKNAQWYWTFVMLAGKTKDVIAMATETYSTKKDCILSIGFVQKYGPDADIRPRIE